MKNQTAKQECADRWLHTTFRQTTFFDLCFTRQKCMKSTFDSCVYKLEIQNLNDSGDEKKKKLPRAFVSINVERSTGRFAAGTYI